MVVMYPAPAPRRKSWPWMVGGAVVLIIALIVLCAGFALSGVSSNDKHGIAIATSHAPENAENPAVAPTTHATKGALLKADDLKLTVKITKKDCFGSVVCNVDYAIRLTALKSLADIDFARGSCDVTYQVTGLKDAQTGTLTLTPDGKYTQDDWQSGQTKHSSDVLKAKVTDIEC